MKSKKQVLTERPEYKTLINGVLNNLGGMSYIEDVNSHGASAGFGNFIYYNDTHKFAMRYRKLIVKLLQEQADDFGHEIVEMVSHFGTFRDRSGNGKSTMDNDDKMELYKYIGGGKCEQSTITNLMAWYALEEVCRMFED
jgi:hypothetical protein